MGQAQRALDLYVAGRQLSPMLPIRDQNPSRRTPYVTWVLIAVNILIFLSYWPLFDNQRAILAFFNEWALVPIRVTQGIDGHGLFTSMFLHGSFLHLASNMLFLWIFGDNLEDALGPVKYLLFYLACGLLAAIAQVAALPMSRVPVVGASGAIAGVMGGYLLLYPKARIDILIFIIFIIRIISVPAWLMLGLWFGIQVLSGLGSDPEFGGVAYWAHAGGFVAGAVLILPVFLRKGAQHHWRRTGGTPPYSRSQYRHTSIPVVRRRK